MIERLSFIGLFYKDAKQRLQLRQGFIYLVATLCQVRTRATNLERNGYPLRQSLSGQDILELYYWKWVLQLTELLHNEDFFAEFTLVECDV